MFYEAAANVKSLQSLRNKDVSESLLLLAALCREPGHESRNQISCVTSVTAVDQVRN